MYWAVTYRPLFWLSVTITAFLFLLDYLHRILKNHTAHACDGETLSIRCPSRTSVAVLSAFYGRRVPSPYLCPYTNLNMTEENTDCTSTTAIQVGCIWWAFIQKHSVFGFLFTLDLLFCFTFPISWGLKNESWLFMPLFDTLQSHSLLSQCQWLDKQSMQPVYLLFTQPVFALLYKAHEGCQLLSII